MIFVFIWRVWEIAGLSWEVSLPAGNLGQHGGFLASRLVGADKVLICLAGHPDPRALKLKSRSPFLTSDVKNDSQIAGEKRENKT